MSVSKAVTIQFVAVSLNEELLVELDSVRNDEETQFKYGDKAYFRVYSYPIALSLTLTPTDGSISEEGNGDSDEEELISFIATNQGSTSKPVRSITSRSWLGNSLGSVSAVGSALTTSQEGTGVLKITYKSNFRRFALTLGTRDEDTYTVIVVVTGE